MAKIKEGKDWIKLSLTFSLTINPETISKCNPDEESKRRTGKR